MIFQKTAEPSVPNSNAGVTAHLALDTDGGGGEVQACHSKDSTPIETDILPDIPIAHKSAANQSSATCMEAVLEEQQVDPAITCVSSSGIETEIHTAPVKTTKPKTAKVYAKKFQDSWCTTFPWVKHDMSSDVMFCTICRQCKNDTVLSSVTQNYRIKTLEDHAKSKGHLAAVAAADPKQGQVLVGFSKAAQTRKAAVILALKTVHWLSVEEIANKKYSSLLHFLRDIDVKDAVHLQKGANATHDSPDIFNQLLECLNFVLERNLKTDLRKSPFVGIGVDESTDRAQEKHVVIVVRYIQKQSATPKTTFLSCVSVRDGTAATVLEAIRTSLNHFGVPIRKVVGLGTDGASSMASSQNGLNGLMKNLNPFTVHVHCVCHRLALSVSQACKDIQLAQAVTTMISTVYTYIQLSPNRLERFKDVAAILESDTVKFRHLFEIRWLCLGEAVVALIRNYEPLMIMVGQHAAEGDLTAASIENHMSQYKFVAMLNLLADILAATNHLSKLFQYRDVSFGSIRTNLQNCLTILEDYQANDGVYMHQMEDMLHEHGSYKGQVLSEAPGRGERQGQRETFIAARTQILENLLANIRQRFPHVDLLDAMQIFDPSAYPIEVGLPLWGINHLETLLAHYGAHHDNREGERFAALVDADQARGEFLVFKRLVYQNRFSTDGDDEWQEEGHFARPTQLMMKIFGGPNMPNQRLYPSMFHLMSMAICVLVGNAEAERVFSVQNRIKTKLRTKLSIVRLEQLIRQSYEKLDRQEFDFDAAADRFLQAPRRL